MKEYTFDPHWSPNEFKIYLFLYAAHADFIESKEERDLIRTKTNPVDFHRIHREFDLDNDYRSIEKIVAHIRYFRLSREEVLDLLSEMKEIQKADHETDQLEKTMLMLLKRIFEQEAIP